MPIVLPVCNFVVVLALPANEAVTTPAAKLPFSSRLTILLAILLDVAEFTADAIFAIALELTPPIVLTVVSPVLTIDTSPDILTAEAVLDMFPTTILLVGKVPPTAVETIGTSFIPVILPLLSTANTGIYSAEP